MTTTATTRLEVVRMNSGRAGETSYANNSSFQRAIASVTKQARQDMAAALYRARGRPASMAIADLGCATGPNALLMVTEAAEAVMMAADECQQAKVELHIFLNDLPGNDFNAVFRLLPESPLAATTTGGGRCRVSAWPGSFYERIFPEGSLDYVVSSSSLHFLSRPPPMLNSNNNRGRIYISASSSSPNYDYDDKQQQHQQAEHAGKKDDEVLEAYASQFHSDFSSFLRCRSPEMRPGGLLLLTFVARRTASPTAHDCYLWDLLADALVGIDVDEELIHSFNAPYYSPCPDDLLKAIGEEGSFSIRTLQLFETTRRHLIINARDNDQSSLDADNRKEKEEEEEELQIPPLLAAETASTVRAVVEPMMRNHFGWAAMDALFCRYRLLLEAYYRNKATRNKDDLTNVFLVLEKKQTTHQ